MAARLWRFLGIFLQRVAEVLKQVRGRSERRSKWRQTRHQALREATRGLLALTRGGDSHTYVVGARPAIPLCSRSSVPVIAKATTLRAEPDEFAEFIHAGDLDRIAPHEVLRS